MTLSRSTLTVFRNNLRVLEREIAKYLKNETACCGVTFSQCHIIMELELQGQMSIKQLAAILELDTSTLSRVVDGMVNLGLVERSVNPDDRRAVIIRLAESGQRIAETINQQCNAHYQQMFASLPEGKHEQVIESIALLSTALKDARQQASPNGMTCCQ